MTNELKQQIDGLIKENSIVLFMKGSKERPHCGFSKQAVDTLKKLTNDFIAIDVLADPALREGIKVYSSWPTIPQLYVDGEFVGGCDIMLDMFNKGELASLLKVEKNPTKPFISFSPHAVSALKKAASESQSNELVRLSIGADFEYGLSFDQQHSEDFLFEEAGVIMDPYSAIRANNLHIDFAEKGPDEGFCFKNPNEPPPVKELSVQELMAWQDQGGSVMLIDVRPESERRLARISFAKPLSGLSAVEIAMLDKNQALVFHCHHGGRSKRMAELWRMRGFTNIYNLSGGIDAWSRVVDKSVPIYN